MKINEIIVRLEKWAETLGYSTKQGDLSEIIKDLREEAKVFSPNAVLAVTSDSKENKKESEVALPLNISIWRKARKMDYVEFCKWFNQFKGNDR